MKKTVPTLPKHPGRPARGIGGLPAWALKRIAEIARAAGASEKKVLELTLQAGFCEIEELYAPIIQYSENLRVRALKGHSHETKPASQTTLPTLPEPVLEPDLEEVTEFDPYDEPETTLEPLPLNVSQRHASGAEAANDFGDPLEPEADRITPLGSREQ